MAQHVHYSKGGEDKEKERYEVQELADQPALRMLRDGGEFLSHAVREARGDKGRHQADERCSDQAEPRPDAAEVVNVVDLEHLQASFLV